MKILLVNPGCLDYRVDDTDAVSVSMGLYYIGAYLKDRQMDVTLVNLAPVRDHQAFFRQSLKETAPDVVGISVLSATRFSAMEAAALAKKNNPGVVTVFGGPGATFLARHLFSVCSALDYIVKGEGEITFFELLTHIQSKSPYPPFYIKGLIFKNSGRIEETRDRELISNLDSLPHPGQYFDLQHVSLSRGCPGTCTFCGSPAFWGRRQVRFHSPAWFADHLSRLVKRGITHFYVSDDTFTMDRKRVIQVCDEIINRGLDITWAAISRVDFLDSEILFKMRQAGCVQISFGVESGSGKIRKNLGKPFKKETIVKAFHLTAAHGMLTRAYFIYGSPGETGDTIAETMDLIAAIKPLSALFYMLVVFPGTALYQGLKQHCRISDSIWNERIEDIPWFQVDKHLDFETVKGFGEQLRNSYYAGVSQFALNVDLIDKQEMYPFHADFLSRLAMTFSHGDYAGNQKIRNSDDTAEKLYQRSLTYGPGARAYLGLGMLHQKKGQFNRAMQIIETGLDKFPADKSLNICMAVSLMNTGEFKRALVYLNKFSSHRDVEPYISACMQRSG